MVGDSFLTTYMGMDSTTMIGSDNIDLFVGVYLSMLMEMRRAIDSKPLLKDSMYLMADMPSGSADHVDKALRNAERMYKFGADTLKLETPTSKELVILEELASAGYLVFAHVGYTPQTGGKKSRAFDIEDAKEILNQIKRAKSAGVIGIVLEGVSTIFLEAVSKEYSDLAIYSIFSGHAPCTGLSLNIWDSVYKPNFQARYFPDTATIDQSTFPSTYTSNAISSHFWHVCRSVIEKSYPKFRKSESCQELIHWLEKETNKEAITL